MTLIGLNLCRKYIASRINKENMMPANYDKMLDARQARRMAAENRLLARQEKLEANAEPMIGELCREGRTVYYCFPVGGKYFESGSHSAVVDYLVRNRYVVLH